jgi:hypothetical protein
MEYPPQQVQKQGGSAGEMTEDEDKWKHNFMIRAPQWLLNDVGDEDLIAIVVNDEHGGDTSLVGWLQKFRQFLIKQSWNCFSVRKHLIDHIFEKGNSK